MIEFRPDAAGSQLNAEQRGQVLPDIITNGVIQIHCSDADMAIDEEPAHGLDATIAVARCLDRS